MNQETGLYVGNYNRNNVMSNTYNPSWKRHPNLSWSNPNNALNPITQPSGFQQPMPQQQAQQSMPQQQMQQQLVSSLENTLKAFMMKTESYMVENNNFIKMTNAFMNRTEMRLQNQEVTIKTLETQVGQFAQCINTRPQGCLPSNTEVAKVMSHEQCKAITTRSGLQLKEKIPESQIQSADQARK